MVGRRGKDARVILAKLLILMNLFACNQDGKGGVQNWVGMGRPQWCPGSLRLKEHVVVVNHWAVLEVDGIDGPVDEFGIEVAA